MRVTVSMVFRVPPVSWIVSVWKWSSPKPYFAFSRPICMTSQPSPTKIAAVTFGCVAWPQSTRSSASKPSPVSAMPQPVPCESAMTPSICG